MQGVPNKTSFSGLWAVKPFRLAKMTKVRGGVHNFRKCNILTHKTPPTFFLKASQTLQANYQILSDLVEFVLE